MSNPNAESLIRERVKAARLRVSAQPFEPAVVDSDRRSLYFTFSNGFPLTRTEVFDFFNRMYPRLVEDVIVPKPKVGRGPSLHGKVVFKYEVIPDWVMKTHERVGFVVNDRPLYCCKYISKKSQTAPTASTSILDGESHPGGESASTASTSLPDGESHPGGEE